MAFCFNPFVLPTREMYEPEHSPLDEGLTQEFAELARKADIEPWPVHRLTGPFGRKRVCAMIKEKRIFVTQASVDQLTPEGVRWALGHELGHLTWLKQRAARQNPKAVKLLLALYLVVLTPIFMVMRIDPVGIHTWISMGVMAVMAGCMIFWSTRDPINSKEIELWCDKKGAELAGNPCAALEALHVMLDEVKPRDAKLVGYPTPAERFAQMEEMCRHSAAEPPLPNPPPQFPDEMS